MGQIIDVFGKNKIDYAKEQSGKIWFSCRGCRIKKKIGIYKNATSLPKT